MKMLRTLTLIVSLLLLFNGLSFGALIGHWTFDDPGNLGADSSGQGNHGTAVGHAAFSNDAVIGTGALLLDGEGDYLTIGLGAANMLANWKSNVTIAAWIKPQQTTKEYTCVFGHRGGDNGIKFGFWKGAFRLTTLGVMDYDLAVSPTLNTWSHVAVTLNAAGNLATFYHNGQQVGQVSGGSVGLTATGYYCIGSGGYWEPEDFKGLIDDCRIYSHALNATEVLQLYESETQAGITGLDIGTTSPVHPAGSTTRVGETGYTVQAGGMDIWVTADSFHYSYNTTKVSGNFTVTVRVHSLAYVDDWSKAGIMCRSSLAENAAHASILRSGTQGIHLQTRPVTGQVTLGWYLGPSGPSDPVWLRLARQGDVFAALYAPDAGGRPGTWSSPVLAVVPMPPAVYLGLATTSHLDGTAVTAEYRSYDPRPLGGFPSLPALGLETIGPAGGMDYMGIREVIGNGPITDQDLCYASLQSLTGTIVDYQAGVLNIADKGEAGHFGNDAEFGVVTAGHRNAGDVDNLSLVAKGAVYIPVAGDYTFCVNSDDGFTLQFPGHHFKEIWGGLGDLVPFGDGHAVRFWGGRGAADTLGVIHLPAGSHPFVLTYHEAVGDASVEFSAAAGRKTAFDEDFRLVGHKGLGTVPIPGFHDDVLMTATQPGRWGQIARLIDAQDALAQGEANQSNVHQAYQAVNHTDPDTATEAGSFGGDEAFPNDTAGTDDDDFAIRVEGLIDIPQTGWYDLGFNSDDGAALTIPGQTWHSKVVDTTGGTATISGDKLSNDILTGWSFTAGRIYLTAGHHAFEAIMFERGGGAFFELFGRGVVNGVPDPQWHLLVRDGAGFFEDQSDGLRLVPQVCPFLLAGDLNRDCVVNLYDLAQMAQNWLVDCYRDSAHPDCQTPTPPPDLVRIPAGTFRMGDSFSEGDADELPVHTVTLDAFYMSKYEITNQQYCDFLNAALDQGLITVVSGVVYQAGAGSEICCDISSTYGGIAYSSGVFSVRTKAGRSMGNDPMIRVTWYGAAAYCNWRSEREGRQPCYDLSTWECDFNKNGYRLPTEAEWEYAARGGLSGKRFPWGDTISHPQANYNSTSYSYDVSLTSGFHPYFNDGTEPYTSPVGSFAPNGYGIHDMAGNVREWCNDWYSYTYYSISPQTNPTGPAAGHCVIRGGWWKDSASFCRVASRFTSGVSRGYVNSEMGFRVVSSCEAIPINLP